MEYDSTKMMMLCSEQSVTLADDEGVPLADDEGVTTPPPLLEVEPSVCAAI